MLNDVGLLLARITLGASIASHGAQKAWGTFDGPGPDSASQFMQSLGFRPGRFYAVAASASELSAGALIALGIGGALGPAMLLSTMVVAQSSLHAKNGFFAQKNGIELGVLYSVAALSLASGGYGRLALDHMFGWHKLRESAITALLVAGGVATGLVILAQRSTGDDATIDTAPAASASAASRSMPDASTAAVPASNQGSGESPELNSVQSHISAASAGRPVPADLLTATDESVGL